MTSILSISADQLDNFAAQFAAAGEFPWLLRRLVSLTTGANARIEFATGKGVHGQGFDGSVDVADFVGDLGKVPKGASVWEVSTREDVTTKANEDYKGRLKNANPDVTYVAVTCRRWRGKKNWEKARTSERAWKEVRAYDAEDIAAWLDDHPILSAQFASRLGVPATQGRSLEEWWENWTKCDYQVSLDWVTSGLDRQLDQLHQQLSGFNVGAPICLAGCSMTDGIAFVCGAISRLPSPRKEELLARTLYLRDVEACKQLGKLADDAIFVLGCPIESVDYSLFRKSNRLVLSGSPISPPGSILLPRPDSRILYERMTRDGVPHELAERATKAARRSLQLMLKELGGHVVPFDPAVEPGLDTRKLTACLLMNRWNGGADADASVVASLSDCDANEVESWLALMSNTEHPFVRKTGPVWYVADAALALAQYGGVLSDGALEQFPLLAKQVLLEDDPTFDLESSERWKAGMLGVQTEYSPTLKEGLARTLSAVSEFDSRIGHYSSGQQFVNAIAGECFEGASSRRWYSLAPSLSLLGEAAPEVFLEALEADLSGAEPPCVAGLFEDDGRAFSSGSRHAYLLWSLERLAWNTDYLFRAASCLCRLQELGFGSKNGNSPIGSLRAIFLPWRPCTAASTETRNVVLSALCESFEEAGWELVLGLLPSGHDVGHNTDRPDFRDWAVEVEPPTYAELKARYDPIVALAIKIAGTHGERLAALVGSFAYYRNEWSQDFLKLLRERATEIRGSGAGEMLWNSLRLTTGNHRRMPSADWAMQPEQLAEFESVMPLFEPPDVVARSTWLFASWVELPEPRTNYEAHDVHELERQVGAIRSIVSEEGIDGIMRLVAVAEAPGKVGRALWRSKELDLKSVNALLIRFLASEDHAARAFALGLASSVYTDLGEDWQTRLLEGENRSSLSAEQRRDLFLSIPNDSKLRARLASESESVQKLFWEGCQPLYADYETEEELRAVVGALLAVNRSEAVVDLLAMRSQAKVSDGIAETVLLAMEALREHLSSGNTPANNIQYEISHCLDVLNDWQAAPIDRVAALEFYFLPAVRFDYEPRAIGRAIATDPALFVQLVDMVFRREGEDPSDVSAERARLGTNAYSLLTSIKQVPGVSDEDVDEDFLNKWIDEVLTIAKSERQDKHAKMCIGTLLAKSPNCKRGVWPSEPIARVFERLNSKVMEDEVICDRIRQLGVRMGDGGSVERGMAEQYEGFAKSTKPQYTRTHHILRGIAEMFHSMAHDADVRDEMHQDL